MHLRASTSIILLLILLMSGGSAKATSDTTNYITSPYRVQYNPWFEFKRFQRGYDLDSITVILDSLQAKSKRVWHRQDSLAFASASLHANNFDLARHYFEQIKVDQEEDGHYWWDRLLIFILENEYEDALDFIQENNPGILQHSKLFFIQRILVAKVKHAKDPKWYKTHSIFNWEVDSTLSYYENKERFTENVVKPLNNCNWVIHFLVRHIHEDDPILSRACYEMGRVLEAYGNWSQAYIAYSLARHYNKRDKEILNQTKEVKAKLLSKMYKVPNFRKYFPRTKKHRLDYEVLKEQIIAARNDTTDKQKPLYLVPVDEFELPFPVELIYVVGIGIIFLMLLLFLRSKKRSKK